MAMNSEVKKKWIEALRSRKYKQGHQMLKQVNNGEEKYCCLGVLCDIVGIKGSFVSDHTEYHTGYYIFDKSEEMLSSSILNKVGLDDTAAKCLAGLNDGEATFSSEKSFFRSKATTKQKFYQIANFLEKHTEI